MLYLDSGRVLRKIIDKIRNLNIQNNFLNIRSAATLVLPSRGGTPEPNIHIYV